MKNIYKIVTLLMIISLVSCKQDYDDHMTGDASEGGAIIEILSSSNGKLLGIPQGSDLGTSALNITDADLDVTYALKFGGQDIEKYEVIKSFNGGSSSVVASSTSLPIHIQYTSLTEFLDGTGVTDSNDLRVGDTFEFKLKLYNKDGKQYYPANGNYSLVVSCSSDLAYTYAVTTVSASGNTLNRTETLLELGPGFYRTESVGTWDPAFLASFGADINLVGYDFNDLCNSISVNNQNLAHFFSNTVYQTEDQANASYVDPATGNIHIEYSITFSSGDNQYVSDYIRQ